MIKEVVLILGAKSDIGIATAHRFAREGYDIQLASRNSEDILSDSYDITIRYGVNASVHEFDALNLPSHDEFVNNLPILPTVAISSIGLLGIQSESQININKAITVIRTNYEGIVSIFGFLSNKFKKRGFGTLIGISSVAGDRGRGSNYIYGSAKAGLSAYLSGLRNSFNNHGINVITVKPGYVRTKMTSNQKLPRILTSSPDKVANSIYFAYKYKKNVVYITPVWKYIMTIIRLLPEWIFVRLKL